MNGPGLRVAFGSVALGNGPRTIAAILRRVFFWVSLKCVTVGCIYEAPSGSLVVRHKILDALYWLPVGEISNRIIATNESDEPDGYGGVIGKRYSAEVLQCFRRAVSYLKRAEKMVHHIDYLLSGDYGEGSFLEAWREDGLHNE